MSREDPIADLRRHFLARYHPLGARVFDCAGNATLWSKIGNMASYVGYDYEAAARAGLSLLFSEVDADIVDIGGSDPWGIYVDVLAGFMDRPVTLFFSIPTKNLRLDDGLEKYVWERVGIPFDWSRWNGPAVDGLVLRAGISCAEACGFTIMDAQAVRFLGKPFPWRYNHVGVRLLPE